MNPLHILTASLYVYAMHVLNRFINRKASSISSFREESYLLHEKIYVSLAVISMVLALSGSFVAGPAPFLLLFVISLWASFTTPGCCPRGWRFQSLKDIPGSKNIATAIAWAAVTSLLPWIEPGPAPTPGSRSPFFFITGIVFIRSALSDILDIQSDRLIGRETLPVLIGGEKTLLLLLCALRPVLLLWARSGRVVDIVQFCPVNLQYFIYGFVLNFMIEGPGFPESSWKDPGERLHRRRRERPAVADGRQGMAA